MRYSASRWPRPCVIVARVGAVCCVLDNLECMILKAVAIENSIAEIQFPEFSVFLDLTKLTKCPTSSINKNREGTTWRSL